MDRQTASTFEAASTFLQLINIWGQPDAETQQKIKFAKWNAARILKAIKEGKDPNESNPKPQENHEEGVAGLDPNDPEVQMIVGADQPRPATVEDAPDDGDDKLHATQQPAGYSSNSPTPAPAPVSAPTSPPPASAPAPEQVSPIAPTEPPSGAESGSYFPNAPTGAKSHTDQDPFTLPSAPGMPAGGLPSAGAHDPRISSPDIPSPSSHVPGMPPFSPPDAASTPQDFYRPAPPPLASASAPTQPPIAPPQQPYAPPPQAPPPASSSSHPYSHPSRTTQPAQAAYSNHTSNANVPTGGYNADDMAIAQAQKHAKWAISALNFEDVQTAVRELQSALATLGAR
ncbi:hypothetical protein SLS62_001064 [Diatrype stigma]|uniref:Uncharacterized protein n=1 Tax=Diatrype stigma TaxID=117547 RepID=A0AAN9UZ86_9PEZI